MGTPRGFSEYAGSAGIKIVDLQAESWQQDLFQAIEPAFDRAPEGNLGQASFLAVLEVAREDLQARTAVIEPYTSTDWHEEYGKVYSRVFLDVPRKASRIHFFRPVGRSGLIRYSQLYQMSQPMKRAYVGYTVLRPLPAFRVGDTVLCSPCRAETDTNDLAYGKDLVHCQTSFRVSVLGNELSVIGMPFIQQETTVGVCAEADLWMVARYLNRLGEVRRYRPAEVTDLATRAATFGQPRDGLFDLQMIDALRQMGLNPCLFYAGTGATEETKEFIFTCVESELPVITGIPEHVMVVIGHDCTDPIRFPRRAVSTNRTMSECVRRFIVHDDAGGPYRRKLAGEKTNKRVTALDDETVTTETIDQFALDDDVVDFCIACLPHRVNLLWDDVPVHAEIWLENIGSWLSAEFDIPAKDLWPKRSLSNMVFRTYLRRSDKFKADMLSAKDSLRHEDFIAYYRCMPMPKYVWVVEMARRKRIEGIAPHERLIEGEMVFDSTGNRHVFAESLLAFHLDGLLYIPDPGGAESMLIVRPNEQPYRPLLRSPSGGLH